MKRRLATHFNRRREAPGVLCSRHDQRIDVRLPQVFEIQLLGQLDDSRGRADVEGARALPLRLQGVTDLAVGERLGFH